MFPFTPHTTLRPDKCSGGSLCDTCFPIIVIIDNHRNALAQLEMWKNNRVDADK
jgi:hypothetical protein